MNLEQILFLCGGLVLLTVGAEFLVRGASVLVLVMGFDGKISRLDGIILFAGAILYTIFAVKQGRQEGAQWRKNMSMNSAPKIKTHRRRYSSGLSSLASPARRFFSPAT